MAIHRTQALWAAVFGCLVGLLAGCTPAATGSGAAEPTPTGRPPGAPTSATGSHVTQLRAMQLNLCDSGLAACYTGRAVAEAATVIEAESPDLVTVNEICQTDLSTLQRALAVAIPGARVGSAFQAAGDRRTDDAYRCRNGQPYGIGLISRWPSLPRSAGDAGIYPIQDTNDPEERAWLCLPVGATPAVTICTTHLADTNRMVAAAQCRYVFGTVISKLREQQPEVPVVLGGDLNLGPGDGAYLRSCLPARSAIADDGGVQHVIATPEFVVTNSLRIDLHAVTDHPGLLVTLTLRALH